MLLDILLTIHFILIILISLRVLARQDFTSPARLAWLVVLFILPYLGVLVYWMFGELRLGRGFTEQSQQIIEDLHKHNPEVLGNDSALIKSVKPEYRAAFAYAANITGFHTTVGNHAELMADADETRRRMIADFDAATCFP